MSLLVDQVSKQYSGTAGPVDALRTVSLCVEPGEMVSIVGPNGAGKTTVFNCLTGFYKPDVGRMRVARDGQ